MAQGEPEPSESQLGDAVLDAMRGGLRILGGIVQVAAGMTRLLAVALLKAAAAAEKVVEATAEDEEKPEPKPRQGAREARAVVSANQLRSESVTQDYSSSMSASSIANPSARAMLPVAETTRVVPTMGATAARTPRTCSSSMPSSLAAPRFNR